MTTDGKADLGRRTVTVTSVSNSNGKVFSNRVAQASGMVSVQADCMLSHAIVLMETRAEHDHMTLEDVATAVIDREIRFGV